MTLQDTSMSIDDLITKENDPEKRATLMVLQQIHQSLLDNTIAVQDMHHRLTDHMGEFRSHREDFRIHAEDEEARLNQIKGGTKAFMWMMAIIQTIIIGSTGMVIGNYLGLSRDFHALELSVTAYHTKVDHLDDMHNTGHK